MEITITGRHVDVTDAMKNYATEKAGKLERHSDLIMRTDVILNVEKETRNCAEMIAHTKVGERLVAKSEHTDMYAAIDLLVDKMDAQVTKQKERVKGERKHARTKASGAKAAGSRQSGSSQTDRAAKGEGPNAGGDDDEGLED